MIEELLKEIRRASDALLTNGTLQSLSGTGAADQGFPQGEPKCGKDEKADERQSAQTSVNVLDGRFVINRVWLMQ